MTIFDVLSGISAALLGSSLVVLASNAATAPRLRRSDRPRRTPRVSVLIPARDEESNLPEVLEAWSKVDYPDWELVVLDDRSTDSTPAILAGHARRDARLKILRGSELPAGWLGKNWACHQLAQAATGELLLFADADVRPAPEALLASVAGLERESGDALSGFGRQLTPSWSTRAVVPLVMEVPLSGFLPLRLATRLRSPSLSAAVGQWFLFRAHAYRAVGGHEAVRDLVVEDIALGRRLKRSGFRLVPAIARDLLEVSMYTGFADTWKGFSKNISRAGKSPAAGFLSVQIPATLCFLSPWILAPTGHFPALLSLAFLVALRTGSALFWKRPPSQLVWHPVGSILILAIGIRSLLTPVWPMAWKGRIPCKTVAQPS